jgi:hypothetical protein
MLRYLDNDSSAGPDSALVRRLARRPRAAGDAPPRITGLNENLAREVLELHTLGVAGGGRGLRRLGRLHPGRRHRSSHAVLTGWRVPLREMLAGRPAPPASPPAASSQPGTSPARRRCSASAIAKARPRSTRCSARPRRASVDGALRCLQSSRATLLPTSHRRISWQLWPRPSCRGGGDLPTPLPCAASGAPAAWSIVSVKLKTPEEFVISSARLLSLGEQAFARAPDGGVAAARAARASGAFTGRLARPRRRVARPGRGLEARGVGHARGQPRRPSGRCTRAWPARALAPCLAEETTRQLERAADGPQALALLLLAPEFQRR